MKRYFLCVTLAATCGIFHGCASHSDQHLLQTDKSEVQLRPIQSRAFDTVDREKMLRAVLATLQDLGFVVESADAGLGAVTGTRYNNPDELHLNRKIQITVTVEPRGEKQLVVRASMRYNLEAVVDAPVYQQFFTILGKELFLEAQQVD